MAEIIKAAGGSGGKIILRAKGMEGVAVEATLNGKTYKGTVGEQGFVDIPLKELGAYSVKVSKDDYTYTQTVNVYQYGITECLALTKKTFADCTPEEIQAIAKAGMASKYWEIGDLHKVTMKDGEEINLQIYDFDHDVGTDGETILPLTLGMKDCFKTKHSMNSSLTNVGGWEKCQFRTNILPSLKENFPDEWQQIMTKCQKKTSAGNQSTVIQTTVDDLFLPSEVELLNLTNYSFPGEGNVYKIFTDNMSRVKSVNGVVDQYWTRSPHRSAAGHFCNIGTTGTNGSSTDANYSYGISLCFCVG